jgi:Mn-dependent DtxR family transcriptional regulator
MFCAEKSSFSWVFFGFCLAIACRMWYSIKQEPTYAFAPKRGQEAITPNRSAEAGGRKSMTIHKSAEDYLETILMLQERIGKVRSIDVVNELGFTKASVSIAMKKLRENGYIAVDGDGYLELLAPGREVAERIYDRHRLLKDAFMQLGVSEENAANDACKVEHILSEETLQKIREHMRKSRAQEQSSETETQE